VEKGSKTSVFRFGLVDPKCVPNLFLNWNVCLLVARKGNWLIFQYCPIVGLKRRRRHLICSLFDRRAQQIHRIFLTRFLISAPKNRLSVVRETFPVIGMIKLYV